MVLFYLPAMMKILLAITVILYSTLTLQAQDDEEAPRMLVAYVAGDIGMAYPIGRYGRRQLDNAFGYGFEMGFKTYRQLFVGVSYHRLQFPSVFQAGFGGGDIRRYSEQHHAAISARWLPVGGPYLRPYVVGRVGAAIHDAGFRFVDFDGSLSERISEYTDTGVLLSAEVGLNVGLFYFLALNVGATYTRTTPMTYVFDTATFDRAATSDTAMWMPKIGVIVSTWEYDETGEARYW